MRFIDICFPENNEIRFIEVAKKIKTDGLIFVYKKENYKKKSNDIYENNEKDILIYKYCINKDMFNFNENYKNRLCIMDESYKLPEKFSQVFVKKIKENNIILGICPWFLKYSVFEISKFIFFIELCKKYKVNLFVCSMAKNPFELKEKKQLHALLNLIIKETRYSNNSILLLNKYIQKNSTI